MIVAYAIAAMVFMAIADYLLKWGQRFGITGPGFMLVQSAAFMPVAMAVALVRDEVYWHPALLLGLVSGVLGHLSLLALVHSLAKGDAVTLVPIARLSFIVTAVLAIIFLREPVTLLRVAGIVCAVLAILSVGGNYAGAREQSSGVRLALISMVLFGAGAFIYKVSVNLGAPPTYLNVWQSIGYASFGTVLLVRSGSTLPLRGPVFRLALVVGALLAVAWVCQGLALALADATIVIPIVQLSFVLTTIFAVIGLRERLTPGKTIGVILAAGAVLALAMS